MWHCTPVQCNFHESQLFPWLELKLVTLINSSHRRRFTSKAAVTSQWELLWHVTSTRSALDDLSWRLLPFHRTSGSPIFSETFSRKTKWVLTDVAINWVPFHGSQIRFLARTLIITTAILVTSHNHSTSFQFMTRIHNVSINASSLFRII